MPFCPSCGHEIDPENVFCANCGYDLASKETPTKESSDWDTETAKPIYEQSQVPPAYSQPVYQPPQRQPAFYPTPYQPAMKAGMVDRCVALIVDGVIASVLNCVSCYIGGIIYSCVKDTIRDGKSFGKGTMNLRVIDYNTGHPASLGQSLIRNCLCSAVDGCLCYIVAFIDEDGRRIGDHLAGTVVIRDQ